MKCDFAEKVSLLIDGELSPIEARATERHLDECAGCRLLHEDFLGLRRQIGSYTSALDPFATQRALARVLGTGRTTAAPDPRARILSALKTPRLGPALAAAAIVVLLALTFGYFGLRHRWERHDHIAQNPGESGPVQKASPNPEPKSTASPDVPANGGGKDRNTPQSPKSPGPVPQRTPLRLPSPDAIPSFSAANQPTSDSADLNSQAVAAAADPETLTASHLEQSELLLRAFRNLRPVRDGERAEVSYERRRAQELFYQNVRLRRDADEAGDVQVATLLDSLEPILLDIANLPKNPDEQEVSAIKERVERKNLVALLQVNSNAVGAR